MRYLMRRVSGVALDVSLLALGVLAGWRFRLWRAGEGRGWTALTPSSSEGLFLVPYWGLPR